MNRWGVRLLGAILLLVFLLVLTHLHRSLLMLQRTQQAAPSATTQP